MARRKKGKRHDLAMDDGGGHVHVARNPRDHVATEYLERTDQETAHSLTYRLLPWARASVLKVRRDRKPV